MSSAAVNRQKSVKMGRAMSSKKIVSASESAELLKLKKQNKAATVVQCMVRKKLALWRVQRIVRSTYERVFDPKAGMYFWYNKITGQSQWTVPYLLELHPKSDHVAAVQFQRITRGFLGRCRCKKKAALKYTRFYDAKLNKFYYMFNSTQKTFWNASPWLLRMQIPMPAEDQMLHESQQRIIELEMLLKAKDEEIAEVRAKRYEELEPEVIKDKVRNARVAARSKHMDEWSVDDLATWFAELRFDDYIATIYSHK